ncbi:lipid II:glycine glycyltransferase FemX [Patescibacteria group bacterium]
MLVREVLPEEKGQFNALATHPLQSWEWGQFRKKTGIKVIRLGVFDTPPALPKSGRPRKPARILATYQLTVHPIPHTGFNILYFPRGPMPDKTMINALLKLGQQEKAVLVKMEPNVGAIVENKPQISSQKNIDQFLIQNKSRPGRSFFHQYTFQIDLTKSENTLLQNMHQKTRYNLRLSQRHGVKVRINNSKKAFDHYLNLMETTTKRQKFYAHSTDYHRKMWETLAPAGIAHLMQATYQNEILAAWVLFIHKNVLYYPYGASSRQHQEVMPTNALMWGAIKFGQEKGCKVFDLWGCLGPNPDPKHPWHGFHRFKAGFGGQLIKFIGTYDLIVDYRLYPLYSLADQLRWKLLNLKAKVI